MPAQTSLVLQGAQQVIEWAANNPKQVKEAGSWLKGVLSRSTPPVLVTGVKSAGKSVLWDHLSGDAYAEDYEPPDVSARVDSGELKGHGPEGRKVRGIVVPGDPYSRARLDAFERHLGSARSEVSGLIYVACAGLAKPRSPDGLAYLEHKLPSLESFVEAKLAEELDDFDKTCHELESYWRKHRRRFWLLVVTAKADLYQDRLPGISSYYCPGGEGLFAQRIEALVANIGRLNVNVDASAVSCLPEDFTWAGTTLRSSLDESVRRAYIGRLRAKIFELCGA